MEKKFLAVLVELDSISLGFAYAGPFDTEKECQEWVEERNKTNLDRTYRWVVQQFTEKL